MKFFEKEVFLLRVFLKIKREKQRFGLFYEGFEFFLENFRFGSRLKMLEEKIFDLGLNFDSFFKIDDDMMA